MMPVLDGFGLLRQLRSDPGTASIPVIMLSARAGEEACVEGLEAGTDDYLVKPFSARELVARVKTHLELARLREQIRLQREDLYSLFAQAPVPISVLRGKSYLEIVQGEDVIGKPLVEGFPEIRTHGFDDLVRRAMQTGEAWLTKEHHVRFDRNRTGAPEDAYFTFVGAPIRDLMAPSIVSCSWSTTLHNRF
jgi:CheY-like chemotaxis protein